MQGYAEEYKVVDGRALFVHIACARAMLRSSTLKVGKQDMKTWLIMFACLYSNGRL